MKNRATISKILICFVAIIIFSGCAVPGGDSPEDSSDTGLDGGGLEASIRKVLEGFTEGSSEQTDDGGTEGIPSECIIDGVAVSPEECEEILAQNESVEEEEATDFAGPTVNVIHRNFGAIIHGEWEEYEYPPHSFVYMPPGTPKDEINSDAITVTVIPINQSQYTLNGLLDQSIESTKEVMPDFTLEEESSAELDGDEAKKIKFTGTHKGLMRKYTQVFSIENNQLYTITYSCPTDKCDHYGVYNYFVKSFEYLGLDEQ